MWKIFGKKLWEINVELELDLIKLTLLYMGGGHYGLPLPILKAHSFIMKVWFGLVQSSYELGHMGTNYHQDKENTSKFQQCLSSMQIVLVFIPWPTFTLLGWVKIWRHLHAMVFISVKNPFVKHFRVIISLIWPLTPKILHYWFWDT